GKSLLAVLGGSVHDCSNLGGRNRRCVSIRWRCGLTFRCSRPPSRYAGCRRLSSGVNRQEQYPDVVVASTRDRSNPVPSVVHRGLGRFPCVPQRPRGCTLSGLEPNDGASCSCLLVEGVAVYWPYTG